jgi:hypothetical protein
VADSSKFGQNPGDRAGVLRCDQWETMLADALDELLPGAEAAAFAAHSDTCPSCADLLTHARQGQQWLEYLHAEPEVPPGLLEKILHQTAAVGAVPAPVMAGAVPGATTAVTALPWRRSFHETRLLMTVAMAFFSIALTLDMAGIRLSNIRLADLRPSSISSTLSRQFYGARGQVVRFYDNLRFVYQFESRMRELRRDVQTSQPATSPQKQPSRQNSDKDGLLNPGPGAILNTGLPREPRVRQDKSELNQATEVNDLIPLGPHRAGPWRSSAAGYDGRSLA